MSTNPVSSADKPEVEPKEEVSKEALERFKDDLFKQKSKNKDIQKDLEDAKNKILAFERAELEKAGNFEEVKKGFQDEIERLQTSHKELKETFAEKTLFKTVKIAAKAKGCKDPDVLLKLVHKDEFKSFMTEDYDIDEKKLSELIESKAKEKPYLFESGANPPRDKAPTNFQPEKKEGLAEALAACKTQNDLNKVYKKFNINVI